MTDHADTIRLSMEIDALREIANYRSLTKPQDHKVVASAALVSLGETE